MKNRLLILVALLVLSLAPGCGKSGTTATALPTQMPQPTDTLEPPATPDSASVDSTPACPPPDGRGTVAPAVSVYSIVFVVNGVEQVVRDGDMLQGRPGDELRIKEVAICVGPFSGNGGEACVDFAPVTQSGREIVSEHRGTHIVRVTPGFTSIPGPDHGWTIGEGWTQISAVLNHWRLKATEDSDCAGGRCERDDRVVIGLR
jgi:hypothetical protein